MAMPAMGTPMSPMGSMAPSPTGGTMPGQGMPQPPMPMPMPSQPSAGGPTSPMNIQSMLSPRQQPGQSPAGPGMGGGAGGGSGPGGPTRVPPVPLPQWGDSAGTPGTMPGMQPGASADLGPVGPGTGPASGIQGLGGEGAGQADPHSPLVFLKLLKALGQV